MTISAFAGQTPSDTIPFAPDKQEAVLGHCVNDPSFFRQTIGRLSPAHWTDLLCTAVYEGMLVFFKRYNRPPTKEELIAWEGWRAQGKDAAAILQKIHDACRNANVFGLDALRDQLTEWVRTKIYYDAVYKSAGEYRERRLNDALTTFSIDRASGALTATAVLKNGVGGVTGLDGAVGVVVVVAADVDVAHQHGEGEGASVERVGFGLGDLGGDGVARGAGV